MNLLLRFYFVILLDFISQNSKLKLINMKNLVLFFSIVVFVFIGFSQQKSLAQGIGIGSPSFTPVASAILELKDPTKGFLTTRVSWSSMPASPADGLLVYVNAGSPTDGFGFYYYDGVAAAWKKVGIPYLAGTGINITGNTISVIYGTTAGTAAEGNHAHAQLHNQSHAMTSTADHTAGNWSVFYSNGSGQVNELGFGAAGQVLSSNGASASPSWINSSGGTVTSVSGVAPISVATGTTTPVISIAVNSQSSAGVVAAGGVNANYVWKTDGAGNPAWRADDNTTYTAGNGLTLTGTQFSLSTPVSIANGGTNASSYTSNQFLWYNGTSIVASGYSNSSFASSTHAHALHTRGTGLTGANYDGSAAATWAVDFGTGATQAAPGNHNHSGVYDNYSYWTLQGSGANGSNVTSGTTINFTGSGSTTVSKSGNTVTISSIGTTYTAGTGISIASNTITNTGVTQITAGTGVTISPVGGTGNVTINSSGITGSGTTNYIPKWTSSSALGNSILLDNATHISSSGSILLPVGAYYNFGLYGSTGYGFRDNAGAIEYKNSGGNWTPFPVMPLIPGTTEYWVRPTSALYIQPQYNAYARVYDNGQTFGFYYDGNNSNGGFFAGGLNGAMGTRGTVADVPIWSGDIFPFVDASSDYYITSADNLTYTGLYGWGAAYMGVTGGCCLDAGVRGIGLGNTSGTNSSWPICGVIGEVIATGSSSNGQQGVYGWQAAPAGTAQLCPGVIGRTSQSGAESAGVAGYYTPTVGSLIEMYSSVSANFGLLGTVNQGAVGYATSASGSAYGGQFNSYYTGSSNPGWTYGIYSYAAGGTQDVRGIYSYATGSASQYAGYFSGNHLISGTKSAAYLDQTGKPRQVYCVESPEIWFEDFGSAKITSGIAEVKIDSEFLPALMINEKHPIKVFITPNSPLGVDWWVEKKNDRFILHAPSAANGSEFDFRIVAKRKGYEEWRLEFAGADVATDPYVLDPYSNKPYRPGENWKKPATDHNYIRAKVQDLGKEYYDKIKEDYIKANPIKKNK
ncbi:MAG: hypothetical protein A2275_07240 [Bacteroidetes bacterium RIFOXYA12_FULL_35_11]|nr:MAG: hypothetical protein A2X01_02995 [Bacteroidetes bacterium GWF2_35_48]OFY72802.1 MAG: hypothetical protein A2275_07240 [Bacteroidetes bacterium RIFOXYA12_FULL_35_11]OFY95098.1 MAG: hypothetical protein A2491_18715 [Bacteroidetes bacterium RIFOXYC12_FULL_35_7]HBX52970.1 hypothetical protein [Bacteroidales bacterium]